jgi:tetratricopeptide (TPR) repeat protein
MSNARAERFTPWALAIFGFALALRLLHLWQLRASPFLEATLGDSAAYDAWARRLAAGDWLGSEVFYQAPLYPYFLGVLYATLGDAPLVVRGLQCVLSAAACALLASAGASLLSRGAGIAAGLLLATYAPSIFLDALLQKSVLDLFFVCLALWLVAGLARAPRPGPAAALGVATGALVLARENALVLAAVFAAWLLSLPALAARRRVALALVFAAGLGAALFPVALRNFWVGGELHLTTSQFGPNLYIGNHPGAPGGYEPLRPGRGTWEYERTDATELAEQALGRRLTPGEVSSYWAGRVVDYVVSQPGDWLRGMARKLVLLLGAVELVDSEDQYATADYSAVLRATGQLGHFGVLAPLAVLGAFVCWPRRRTLWWLYGCLAAYAASVLIFYVFARYRYPLVPFLALLAGAGLVGARSWLATQGRREVVACVALALGLTLVSNGVAGLPKASMRAVTHLNLGNFFEQEGQPERAVEHYAKALALDPRLEDVANNLAATLVELGRPAEAIALYERSLAEQPSEAKLHRNLASLLRAQGAYERALEHFRRAVELDPADAAARDQLVQLHVERAAQLAARGDAAGALAHYRGALAARPGATAALWGAAWILASEPALRRPEEALALAERAAASAPRLNASMLEVLAAAYAAVGRFEDAVQKAREAVALLAAQGRPPPPRLAQALSDYERGRPLDLPGPDAAQR